MTTIERLADDVAGAPHRRRPLALFAVVVLTAVGAAFWAITNGNGEKDPIETVQELAAAMREK